MINQTPYIYKMDAYHYLTRINYINQMYIILNAI